MQKCVAEDRKWEETVALKLTGVSEAEGDLDLFHGWQKSRFLKTFLGFYSFFIGL